MQNRRDQVQAHLFTMGRLTSGLLRSDLDAPESPVGRTNRGLVMGVLVALLVSAGAFVFGLISPGGSGTWQSPGKLIVDARTGARYLYADGRLRPVRNYASALLLVGSQKLSTTTVGHETLRHALRGPAVGLEGAPDTLPDGGDLTARRPWLICSTDASAARTTLAVASPVAESGDPLPAHEAVLVRGPDGNRYLVWRGSRLRIDAAGGALESLGYGTTAARPVSAAFLNALPAGPDLTPATVPGTGDAGPSLGGMSTRIGQVFETQVPGSAPQYYLLRQEGLVPLTATRAALQLGAPDTVQKAYGGGTAAARQVQAGALAGHFAASVDADRSALPTSPPDVTGVPDGSAVCASVSPGTAAGAEVRVDVRTVAVSELASAVARTGGPAAGAGACLSLDAVAVAPGSGALVQALSAGGGDVDGSTYLVGDSGAKYRVPTDEDLGALGYSAGEITRVPALLLAMLPSGPDLDADAAARGHVTASGNGCAGTSG
ncbi:type VII secretion protein EccB [Streptomyces griseorubiginosus]|uniref:type VII secretion protein EccB n=1 Tax=Streptomyces griseorubiginosus TaxID=67304 RepID=UPI001AD793F5|nr:type VII secretion protein EccB [Streptomyces griseorubiginosus]MBO4257488.1 type VII secretion protein EccB [Streptomyces griseorubiginosus]